MKSSLATLLLLLLAAGGLLIGGILLARREENLRTQTDRILLREFSDSFQAEVERLGRLYEGHLEGVARTADPENHYLTKKLGSSLVGVSECLFFSGSFPFPPTVVKVSVEPDAPKLIREQEGGIKGPNTVQVPQELFSAEPPRGWLPLKNPRWEAYWARTPQGITLLLVDLHKVRKSVASHLTGWFPDAFAPLRQAGELVTVASDSSHLLGPEIPQNSPISVTIPIKHRLGFWEIKAWDRITAMTTYDATTLGVSLTCSLLLAGLGVFYFQQQRRLIRLAEERVSFVNRVSHELGTPLTNVLLNLSLAEDALENHPVRARERLRITAEEVQRLARLVDNVLTFSRKERGQLQLQPSPCVPDEVVAVVVAQFEEALKRRDVVVEWTREAGACVEISADAVSQIVGNLFSNVEKYAATGGWLGLVTRQREGMLTITVADQGPGIPPGERSRVFQPFERLDSRVNEGSSGTGLGLAISRDLAQRMGGSLTLLPTEHHCVFQLEVPAPLCALSLPPPP